MSSQNDGKSTFLRDLCPPALTNYITENIEIDNKDGRIALCQNFFINLDELSKLNKKDVNTIKSFISQDKVKDRLPYAKKAQTFQRRANFIGSTNKGEFLIDETGNVRWLIFEIEGIQHNNGGLNGYNKNVDIDLVWSQAYSLFKSGFNFQLTADELRKSESNNTSFRVTTAEMELLQQYFVTADENDEQAEFLTATKITERLTLKTTIKVNPMYLGRALTALQFQVKQKYSKENGYQIKGYFVKEINKISAILKVLQMSY
jgi:predicted P-loop ATPase